MDIETFLLDLKDLFNDMLISGVNYIPVSMIKKLKTYHENSKNYNLSVLDNLIGKFIDDENNRNKYFTDISIWLDVAIIEYENMSV